jgi:hypothetical protein
MNNKKIEAPLLVLLSAFIAALVSIGACALIAYLVYRFVP